jgi:peptide/nickel transport system ATP-binding protein
MEAVLSIQKLSVTFPTTTGPFKAVSEVDLELRAEERLALMGESGSGKSVLGHAVIGLLDNIARVEGSVKFLGSELRSMDNREMTRLRGSRIALIPQSPATALDPVIKIGRQIEEMFVISGLTNKIQRKQLTIKKLEDVGFSQAERIFNSYPHQLSGGMCERSVVAMGAALDPLLLIADEPTKGLDPLSKADVLRLLIKNSEYKSLIMITHDYHAAKICNTVAIMYAGEIIEYGPQQSILKRPRHPYTIGLWNAMPDNGLHPIPESHQYENGAGCKFYGRCCKSRQDCSDMQALRDLGSGHYVRCCLA